MTINDPFPDPDPPDSDDSRLWESVTKDIKPLKGRKKQTSARAVPLKKPTKAAVAPITKTPSLPSMPSGQGIDKRTDERLRRGQMAIEARLDLHGLRLFEAQDAFRRFILDCHARQLRCLLIITGKGKRTTADGLPQAGGVIRENLPLWLEDAALRPLILQIYPAQPKDGGSGAFYILLRRKRG